MVPRNSISVYKFVTTELVSLCHGGDVVTRNHDGCTFPTLHLCDIFDSEYYCS